MVMMGRHHEILESTRLIAIAVVSAVLVATLVISVGEGWLRRSASAPEPDVVVEIVRTGG